YTSPGRRTYSYDTHRGAANWEIWVSALPLYKLDLPGTIAALNRYFAKNHAYRTGQYDLPRAFLEVDEHATATTAAEHAFFMQALRTGDYPWMPFTLSDNARIYFNSPLFGLTVDRGYADLSAGVADFTDLDAHGYWGASGKIDIAWVEKNPVRTA